LQAVTQELMDLEEQNRKLRAQVVELEEQKEEVPIEEKYTKYGSE